MATPGGPRPGNFPPNYNPNALVNNMQNLQINQPNQQQSSNPSGTSAPRPSNTSPFGQVPPSFTGNQPRPPPNGVFLRGPMPPGASSQGTLRPNVVPSFASRPPPPGALPSAFGGPHGPTHSRPGPVSSSPQTSGPPNRPQLITPGPPVNGPPSFPPGMTQGGPRFPAIGSMPRPLGGPPQSPTMRPSFGNPPAGPPTSMGRPSPPFSAVPQAPPFSALPGGIPPPGSSPFSPPHPGMPQPSGSPYGIQTWPPQPQQVGPIPGPMHQQQRIFGMPPGPLPLPNQSMTLGQARQSRIDPTQIPHLSSSSDVVLHETHKDNQANPPPPATSDYIVKDTGNCSPRYMRCPVHQIPCTLDLLSTSAMQLALLVQPLALPHPAEEPMQAQLDIK